MRYNKSLYSLGVSGNFPSFIEDNIYVCSEYNAKALHREFHTD